ncbi:hypothetical protein GP486_005797 [Trichoglossum hirsutum]|uniref:Homeobox domain-containing protein n=1 Tax=Trichoglossum hirsutum TaxID=265104 RepID=A0A9P8L8J5_9PEZI|nr:hypothetical protein GP486_005797 [Trichoglossum hirsutum]
MVFTSTFDRQLAVRLRDHNSEFVVTDDMFNALKDFTEKTRPCIENCIKDDEVLEEDLSLNRTLTFPPDMKVDKELVLLLNEVFKQETKLANVMINALKNAPDVEEDIATSREALHRAAVVAIVTEKVAAALERSGNVLPPHTRRLRPGSSKLFEHVFRVCQIPQPEELEILADVGGISAERAKFWFEDKRRRMVPVYLAREGISGKGRVAHFYVKTYEQMANCRYLEKDRQTPDHEQLLRYECDNVETLELASAMEIDS